VAAKIYRGLPSPGVLMSTIAVIALGSLAWVLLAMLLALFMGRMTRLRDSQRSDRSEPARPVEHGSGDGAKSFRERARWRLRNKT
jgi:hypothetical protein